MVIHGVKIRYTTSELSVSLREERKEEWSLTFCLKVTMSYVLFSSTKFVL